MTIAVTQPQRRFRNALKRVVTAIHGLAAGYPPIARRYLGVFRLAQYLPDRAWKINLTSSPRSVDWPDVQLAPAEVNLGSVRVTMIPHIEEFDFAAHIYRRITYEQEVVDWLASRNYDAVIEIGANVGVYTLLLSRLFPSARIFSFEPSRLAYLRLLNNLALNSCGNVYTFNCAVGAESAFMDFYEPEGHLTNGAFDASFAGLFSDTVTATKVAAMSGRTMADLVQRGNRVLLKIDVEGAEPMVMASLRDFILMIKPEIVIEVLSQTTEGLNQLDFLENYELYQLSSEGLQPRDAFMAGGYRDYALLPRTIA